MPFTPPADLNAFAGIVVRAEAPWIRRDTHLRGRITIHCGTRTCTLRVYNRADHLRDVERISYRPVKRHELMIFEDLSGWVRCEHRTWLLEPINH